MSIITLANISRALGISIEEAFLSLEGFVLSAGAATGNGAASASTVELGWVPFRHFKIVGVGALVTGNGATTKAEAFTVGMPAQDAGAADVDYFGKFAMDTTDGDQWTAGDIIYHGQFFTPDAEANAGTTTYSDPGSKAALNKWMTKPMWLQATKSNVADSTATLLPFAIGIIGGST